MKYLQHLMFAAGGWSYPAHMTDQAPLIHSAVTLFEADHLPGNSVLSYNSQKEHQIHN